MCKCIENAESKTIDFFIPVAQTRASLGPTLTPSSLDAKFSCYRCHCRNALLKSAIIHLFQVNNRNPTIINKIFVGHVISRMMSAPMRRPAVCLHYKKEITNGQHGLLSAFLLGFAKSRKNVPASPSTAVMNQCKGFFIFYVLTKLVLRIPITHKMNEIEN